MKTSDTLALIGLALTVLAIAALCGFWWAVLSAGLALCAMAYVAHTYEEADADDLKGDSTLPDVAEHRRRIA